MNADDIERRLFTKPTTQLRPAWKWSAGSPSSPIDRVIRRLDRIIALFREGEAK